jgi:AraC-like DNA-binding protein
VIDKQYAGYHTLQYMSAGTVELMVGERRYALEGRAFWSAYPGPRFRFHAAAGQASWSHRYIAFQGPLVKRWERENLFPVPPRPSPQDKDFASRFDELLECSRRSDARGVRRAVHLLEGILMELADAPLPADVDDDSAAWLQRMTRMLDASVASPAVGLPADVPDYAALAGSVGVSERTLRRRFRDATGTSPHAYVLRRKTEEARRLLGETDLPIKAIAKRLGYADVYFFSRQFRQLAGVPPAQYRRSRQQ